MRHLAFVLLLACTQATCTPAPNPYLHLEREARGEELVLRLVPVGGARINAQNPPALEREGREVVRFASDRVTEDSAYFTAPPEVAIGGSPRGRIVASVCPEGELVCRVVTLPVR